MKTAASTQYVRTPDTIAGAAVGMGLVALKNLLTKPPVDKEGNPKSRWHHYLIGAIGGAAAGNAAGLAARRYVANSIVPVGYNSKDIIESLKPKSFTDLLERMQRTVVEDKPTVDLENRMSINPAISFRRELVRRNMGLHTDNPASDWLIPTSKDEVTLNPNVTFPTASSAENESRREIMRLLQSAKDHPKVPKPGESPTEFRHRGPNGRYTIQRLFGGYGQEADGTLTDTWSYGGNPAETVDATKRILGIGLEPPPLGSAYNRHNYATPEQKEQFDSSSVMRYIADKLVDTQQTKVRIPVNNYNFKQFEKSPT